MMGLDNPIHILFLLVIVLLVFGAKRLPEMGKSLGEGLRGFKDSVSGETSITHTHMTSDAAPAHSPAQVDALPVATPLPTEPVQETSGEWTTQPHGEPTPVRPAA